MSLIDTIMATPLAHRGLHDLAAGVAENSASAFRAAAEMGYSIECDLQLSRDGVPMVVHDATIDRVTGKTGHVRDLDAADIAKMALLGSAEPEYPLTLSQLLQLVNSKVAIAIELKPQVDGRDAELAKATLSALEFYTGPVTCISFSPLLLMLLRQYGFTGPLGIVMENFVSELARSRLTSKQRFLMRHLLHYPRTRFDFVDCKHDALQLPAVRLFHFLGFPLITWTVKSQTEADAALDHCDQITFEGFFPARV